MDYTESIYTYCKNLDKSYDLPIRLYPQDEEDNTKAFYKSVCREINEYLSMKLKKGQECFAYYASDGFVKFISAERDHFDFDVMCEICSLSLGELFLLSQGSFLSRV